MIYDDYDEEEKRLEDYDDEDDETEEGENDIIGFSSESNMTNDFDIQGFPVHEAVDFYHGKTKRVTKGKFTMFGFDDFLGGNKSLLDSKTDIMGQDLLNLGSLGKKGKKGKKNKGLIGQNSIFKL
jgi:hypothetical protein